MDGNNKPVLVMNSLADLLLVHCNRDFDILLLSS